MIQKNHLYHVVEFIVGLLFGLGLMLSGMTDPGKVIGFLDLFGTWDPSLALVMGGAIMVGVFAFTVAKKRTTTLLGGVLRFPTNTVIDKKLVIGSLMFGAGWGLAGAFVTGALTAGVLGAGLAGFAAAGLSFGLSAFFALARSCAARSASPLDTITPTSLLAAPAAASPATCTRLVIAAALACAMASTVCGFTPSSAATTRAR